MKDTKRLADDGYYMSPFFYLKIETDKDFQALFGTPEEAVLVHEYVHFLQDVSTTFGLAYTAYSAHLIKALVSFLKNNLGREIRRPIEISSLRQYLQINTSLFEIYLGDSVEIQVEKGMTVETIKETARTVEGYTVPVFDVSIQSHQGPELTYRFGASVIMEGMAKLIEEYIYPEYESPSLLQYHLVEKVTDHIYPGYGGGHKANLVALCDVSLLHVHPAELFSKLLYMMRDASFLPTVPNDVYRFALENISFDGNSGSTNIVGVLKEQSLDTARLIQSLFPSVNFEAVSKWGAEMVHKALRQRLDRYDFISRLLTMKRADARTLIFSRLMYDIGVPLVTNINESCWTLCDGDGSLPSPLYYRAIYEVYSHLKDGNIWTRCSMKKGCESYSLEVDERCDEAPWKKAEDQDLCPFATIWRLWGLQDVRLI